MFSCLLCINSKLQTSLCFADAHSIIGTSSLRRAAQLRRNYPHLQIGDVVSFDAQLKNVAIMDYFDTLLCTCQIQEMLHVVSFVALSVKYMRLICT